MSNNLTFAGIIPANLLPFNSDFSIDEKNYRRHLSWLANTSGVTGIVCNGHAAEVSSLNREERRKALAIAVEEVGDKVPLISGIFTESTLEAIELARDAKKEGASGLLIFPPSLFMFGAQNHPEMVSGVPARIGHHKAKVAGVFRQPRKGWRIFKFDLESRTAWSSDVNCAAGMVLTEARWCRDGEDLGDG